MTHTLSVRLSHKDTAYLYELNLPNAGTISEKVRQLIDLHRNDQAFEQKIRQIRDEIQAGEKESGKHSHLLSRLMAELPHLVATVTAQYETLEQRDHASAKALAGLMESILPLFANRETIGYSEKTADNFNSTWHLLELLMAGELYEQES